MTKHHTSEANYTPNNTPACKAFTKIQSTDTVSTYLSKVIPFPTNTKGGSLALGLPL